MLGNWPVSLSKRDKARERWPHATFPIVSILDFSQGLELQFKYRDIFCKCWNATAFPAINRNKNASSSSPLRLFSPAYPAPYSDYLVLSFFKKNQHIYKKCILTYSHTWNSLRHSHIFTNMPICFLMCALVFIKYETMFLNHGHISSKPPFPSPNNFKYFIVC